MKVNLQGCATCGSTWGDTWSTIDGESMFFCCEVCVRQFQGLVERIRGAAGWESIEALEISGDRRRRTVSARHGETIRSFVVAFTPQGDVREFREVPRTSD